MFSDNYSHSISPNKVLRGKLAWEEGKHLIPKITSKPILIGRSKQTRETRQFIEKELNKLECTVISSEINHDCCELDLQKLENIVLQEKVNGVISAGGGKVLDVGKLLADKLSIPCITIPLSSATCAGWTALSNLYTPSGSFLRDFKLKQCPDLLIFDHNFVKLAPRRTLASGISDALAKWYEASLSSSSSDDGLVQQAVQLSRILRDQLFIDGYKALNNIDSPEWVRVSEGCALTAGLIGGIGGVRCRTAIAHPIHNGLTQLKYNDKPLHGELVGLGLIIQLTIEKEICNNKLAEQSRQQLSNFLQKIGIPVDIESLGLQKITRAELTTIAEFACKKNSDIHQIPFKISKDDLLNILLDQKTKILN